MRASDCTGRPSAALHRDRGRVEGADDGVELGVAQRPARQAHAQGEAQIVHRPHDLRRRAAAMGGIDRGDPGEDRIDRRLVGGERGLALGVTA